MAQIRGSVGEAPTHRLSHASCSYRVPLYRALDRKGHSASHGGFLSGLPCFVRACNYACPDPLQVVVVVVSRTAHGSAP